MPKSYSHRFLAVNLPVEHQVWVEGVLRAEYEQMQVVDQYASTRLPKTHTILLLDLGTEVDYYTRVWLDGQEGQGIITFWHTYWPEAEEEARQKQEQEQEGETQDV